MRRRFWILLFGLSLTVSVHSGRVLHAEAPEFNIFNLPAISQLEKEITGLIERRRFAVAYERLEPIIAAYPGYPTFHIARAILAARLGQTEEAIGEFEAAWALGNRQLVALVESAPFDALKADPRIAALLSDPSPPASAAGPDVGEPRPAPVTRGRALVSAQNTGWDPKARRLVSLFQFPEVLKKKPVMTGKDPVAPRLRKLVASGKAAGLVGDLYDNRDRGHATLRKKLFPQLTWVDYAPEARMAGIEYGYNAHILFNAITFGNSSTAIKGKDRWRSQPRMALSSRRGAADLALSYATNQIYLFPEHRDHDPSSDKGMGDVFHANTPYVLISQGSSKSERRMMEAVGVILAGLPPATKEFIKAKNLVAPTVQQIFRTAQPGIGEADAYLSPAAHPSAFDAKAIDLNRMLDLAQAMQAGDIPPAVQLDVTSETSTPVPFADGYGEVVFDTPGAISRIHRSTSQTREMSVSAGATKDPNGRPLTYRWVLLRGDPDRVTIEPDAGAGASATLRIGWHDRFLAPTTPAIESSRVDIGVFANNGVHWSAPAFISIHFPPNQKRDYDADGRIQSIDFEGWSKVERYSDPFLIPRRSWRDDFQYGDDGRLLGWTRYPKSGK
ncbi:MAG: hypothetical protein AAGA26_06665, partial [Pseudomonadota bacterium]